MIETFSIQEQVTIYSALQEAIRDLMSARELSLSTATWPQFAKHIESAERLLNAIPKYLQADADGAAIVIADSGGDGPPPSSDKDAPLLQIGPGGDFRRAYGDDGNGELIEVEPL